MLSIVNRTSAPLVRSTSSVANAYARCFSAGANLVTIESADNGVGIVKMNAPPTNVLSLEMLSSLNDAIKTIESDKQYTSAVLTSCSPIFSAGLDIKELHNPNKERFDAWWGSLQSTFHLLFASKKPFVAAVTGASPAGGCWLALGCEYRVMSNAPKSIIGLNETKLGIVAPPWFANPLINTVGPRIAERMLLLGQLIPAQEALAVGLVDEICPPEEVLNKALAAAKTYGAIPRQARHLTKLTVRQPYLSLLQTEEQKKHDIEYTWNFVTKKEVQAGIAMYLQSLSKKQ